MTSGHPEMKDGTVLCKGKGNPMFPDYQCGFTGGPGYDASPHAIPLASGKGCLNLDVHGNHLGIW